MDSCKMSTECRKCRWQTGQYCPCLKINSATAGEMRRLKIRVQNSECFTLQPVSRESRRLIEYDNIEEGTANAQSVVVIDEAQFPGLIQKETDSRSHGADHIGQSFLTDLWNDEFFHLDFLPKMASSNRILTSCFSLELKS